MSRSDAEPRAETEGRERRRRNTSEMDGYQRGKLAVPAEMKQPGYEYRWINDTGSRVHDMTALDDWDVVKKGREIVRQRVGVNEDGTPLHAVLVRKRSDLFEADQRQRSERVNKPMRELASQRRHDQRRDGVTYVASDVEISSAD